MSVPHERAPAAESQPIESAPTRAPAHECALKLTRRDLAAWLMSVRARLGNAVRSMEAVCAAVEDPEHLLHGALDAARLGSVAVELNDLTADLCCVLVDCPPGDPVGYAEGFMNNSTT